MIMGAVYLAYSAYFLSSDFAGVRKFMIAVITVLYLGLGAANLRSLLQCLKLLKNMII
jgi:hypothetical protein